MDIENTNNVSSSVDVTTELPKMPTEDNFNFMDHVSDDYKDNKTLSQYKDLNGLVKSHIELNKMIGDRIKVPTEGATEEELNKFYSKLGRPESADKYEFAKLENKPEGFELNEESMKEFKDLAFKLGLTNEQAKQLENHYTQKAIDYHTKNYISEEAKDKEFNEKGKEIFGDKFDDVIKNTSKLLSENLTKEQYKQLEKLDNDSLLLITSAMNNLEKKFVSQDTINPNNTSIATPDDKKNELSALVKQRDSMNKFHPDYEIVNKKISKLYEEGIKLF